MHKLYTRTRRFAAPVLVGLLALAAAPGRAIELTYTADFIGTPAGHADVVLDITDGRYTVTGEARSAGLMRLMTRWHSRFEVSGRMVDGRPVTESYHYQEIDKGKNRVVQLFQGMLNVFKNGKPRDPRPAPSLDLISALFVPGNCQVPDEVFNSRYRYRMALLSAEVLEQPSSDTGAPADPGADAAPPLAMACRYEVVDDDEDRWLVRVDLARVGDHLVPADMRIDGVIGRVRLASAVVPPPSPPQQESAERPALGLSLGGQPAAD